MWDDRDGVEFAVRQGTPVSSPNDVIPKDLGWVRQSCSPVTDASSCGGSQQCCQKLSRSPKRITLSSIPRAPVPVTAVISVKPPKVPNAAVGVQLQIRDVGSPIGEVRRVCGVQGFGPELQADLLSQLHFPKSRGPGSPGGTTHDVESRRAEAGLSDRSERERIKERLARPVPPSFATLGFTRSARCELPAALSEVLEAVTVNGVPV